MIIFLIIFYRFWAHFRPQKHAKINQNISSKSSQQHINKKSKMLKFICVLQYSRALAIKIICQKIIKNQYKSSSTTHLKTTSYFQHIFTPFRPPFRPQNPPKIYLKINTSQLNTSQLNTSQLNTTHQQKLSKKHITSKPYQNAL